MAVRQPEPDRECPQQSQRTNSVDTRVTERRREAARDYFEDEVGGKHACHRDHGSPTVCRPKERPESRECDEHSDEVVAWSTEREIAGERNPAEVRGSTK